MTLMVEILGQTTILLISGAIFSFIVWKLRRRKMDFGEFVGKYGEILGYGGLFVIALVIGLIQWWTS
jgi:hypothetical protein